MNEKLHSPVRINVAQLLADPPHLAQTPSRPADPGTLFAVRQQWAQFLRTSALRAPPGERREEETDRLPAEKG